MTHLYPIIQHCTPDFYGRCATGQMSWDDIKNSLDAQVRSGHLPSPSNALYVIHMAPSTTTSNLCNGVLGFNGYYDTFDLFNDPGQRTRYYAVIPDQTSPCNLGYDGVTRVLSHEIAENMTDPHGNGWEDDTQTCNGGHQIGDICNNIPTVIATPYTQPSTGSNTLTVQKLWSNKLGACVTEDVLWAADK
jgi:hypothetical protein